MFYKQEFIILKSTIFKDYTFLSRIMIGLFLRLTLVINIENL